MGLRPERDPHGEHRVRGIHPQPGDAITSTRRSPTACSMQVTTPARAVWFVLGRRLADPRGRSRSAQVRRADASPSAARPATVGAARPTATLPKLSTIAQGSAMLLDICSLALHTRPEHGGRCGGVPWALLRFRSAHRSLALAGRLALMARPAAGRRHPPTPAPATPAPTRRPGRRPQRGRGDPRARLPLVRRREQL